MAYPDNAESLCHCVITGQPGHSVLGAVKDQAHSCSALVACNCLNAIAVCVCLRCSLYFITFIHIKSRASFKTTKIVVFIFLWYILLLGLHTKTFEMGMAFPNFYGLGQPPVVGHYKMFYCRFKRQRASAPDKAGNLPVPTPRSWRREYVPKSWLSGTCKVTPCIEVSIQSYAETNCFSGIFESTKCGPL